MMKTKKYKLVFAPDSIKEIKEIVKRYNTVQKGLGKRFKKNLKQALEKTKKYPFANSVRYDDVRFSIPEKFPYSAHYTIDEKEKKLIIYLCCSCI